MRKLLLASKLVATVLLIPTSALAQNTDPDTGTVILGLVIIGLAIALYFLPAIIASNRGINASGVLFFLNLLFGWTLIGWIVLLIWAASGATKAQDAFYRNANATLNPDAYARERARLDHEASRR